MNGFGVPPKIRALSQPLDAGLGFETTFDLIHIFFHPWNSSIIPLLNWFLSLPTVLNRLPRCRNGESGPKVLGPVPSRRLSFIPNFPTPAEGLSVPPGSQLLIPEIFHDILEVLRTFLDILATCWKNMNLE